MTLGHPYNVEMYVVNVANNVQITHKQITTDNQSLRKFMQNSHSYSGAW